VLAAITLFFSGFNIMEASLPSLVTKTAPADAKGTATGIYSSSQFLGIFVLHAILTASFLAVPNLLERSLHVTTHDQWIVYLPVLIVSVAVMVPAIIIAEKYRRMKAIIVAAIIALAASQIMLGAEPGNLYVVLGAIVLFFSGFNIMEASLPSLITKTAPPDAKGTASGIYSSSQFLGIFIGGVVGGWAHQAGGAAALFAFTTALAVVWIVVAASMKPPRYLASKLIRISDRSCEDVDTLAARLRRLPGVAEAVVVSEERLAYLKVDSKIFDPAAAESLARGV
jgi:predicted MFS family arabinose efflux permease